MNMHIYRIIYHLNTAIIGSKVTAGDTFTQNYSGCLAMTGNQSARSEQLNTKTFHKKTLFLEPFSQRILAEEKGLSPCNQASI